MILPARPVEKPAVVSSCRSCGARIVWATTTSGKSMPVDVDPDPRGNVLLLEQDGAYQADVLNEGRKLIARGNGARLRTSHFATCPDSAGWRAAK